jgi:hypothetical protein
MAPIASIIIGINFFTLDTRLLLLLLLLLSLLFTLKGYIEWLENINISYNILPSFYLFIKYIFP